MASNIENILSELRNLDERIAQNPTDPEEIKELTEKHKKLSQKFLEATQLLNDKSKVLKG